MEIVIGARVSGKTTLCIEKLKNNPYAVLITATIFQSDNLKKQYPKFKDRIFNANKFAYMKDWKGCDVILDDSDEMNWDDLVRISVNHDIIFIATTLWSGYNNDGTWTRMAMRKYGYKFLPTRMTSLQVGSLKHQLNDEDFEKAFQLKFQTKQREKFIFR